MGLLLLLLGMMLLVTASGAPGDCNQGPQGLPGLNGAPGADGAIGPPGPSGPPGWNGTDGATGATGPTGAIGATGPPGRNGTDGATGAQGTQGPVGPSGAQGEQGLPGLVVVSSYPYPVPTTIANQLHFFGDSITIGTASAGTPWADRLTVYLNKTHSNSGVFAAPLGDLIRHMHNADKTVWTGRTVFICMGVNDLKSASRTAQQYQELQMIINNAAIYGSLPVSAFINVRDDTRVVRNGTWINAPVFTSVGMGGLAADPGLWVQTNVTGRFVGFQFTVTVSMSATVHPVITTIIDGQTIQVGLRSMGTLPTSGLAGGGNYGRIWIWDTNSAAGERHHIKLMFGVTGNYASNVYIDNFLGFDYGHIGAATVLMGEIGNYVHMAWQGTLTNLQTLNNAFELVAYNARAVYGLPVYVAKNVYNFNEAQLDPDLLHPNPGGSEFVAQQFLRVIASLPT